MGEEHKKSLTGAEVAKILGNLGLAVNKALADDGKISIGEWGELAVNTAQEVFAEYTDDDDI